MVIDQKPVALISVSNKKNISAFARKLVGAGYRIVSTGNTAKQLEEDGIPVSRVSELIDFPEIMDGRVKTLHPRIHGALLGDRTKESHLEAMKEHDIPDIQVVVANLYPFEDSVAKEGITDEEAIENIDIGGPAMLRAAAKNFKNIIVVCDPNDYDFVATNLARKHDLSLEQRERLALKAFNLTRDYDAAIAAYFTRTEEKLPDTLNLALFKSKDLRYGENPHQEGAIYHRRGEKASPTMPLGETFMQLSGKELSYNNLIDLDAGLQLIAEFHGPAAAILKHTNPSGCAMSEDLLDAFNKALACDPISAFGGIVVFNREVNTSVAAQLVDSFYEIVIAPGFTDGALEVLITKKNLRIILYDQEKFSLPVYTIRHTPFGFVAQATDPVIRLSQQELDFVTKRTPSKDEMHSLGFAWRVCKHVKSNAIVLVKGTQTVGIGAGQMSRIDSVKLAAEKANVDLKGAVLASDAFFPFRDGPDAAAELGISAIIQPGGSRRDQEVIDACDEHEIAMVFTKKRHFRH